MSEKKPFHYEDISSLEWRNSDGTGNNTANTGSSGAQLKRLGDANYEGNDGKTPVGLNTAGDFDDIRDISNKVVAENGESTPNQFGSSDLFTVFGQFIDHDIDITFEQDGPGKETITIEGDGTPGGLADIEFTRSDPTSGGTSVNDPREYANEITAFLDASNVYGSSSELTHTLRTDGGYGAYLLTSDGYEVKQDGTGTYLPTQGMMKDLYGDNVPEKIVFGGEDKDLWIGGDVRANENIALTALHTVWVREHNHQVDQLKELYPDWDDETLFNTARTIVEAQYQNIVYNEYLPELLGENALSDYVGYNENVDPGIFLEFSTAAFRFGHSQVSSIMARLDEQGMEGYGNHANLFESFFNPDAIKDYGIDTLLRGLAGKTGQEIDVNIVEDLRTLLFAVPGPDGAPGLDLAALNIARGRDHGVQSLNDMRDAMGLNKHATYLDMAGGDAAVAAALEAAYGAGNVDDVDLWIGGLAEAEWGGSQLGETFHKIVTLQFENLRDGDKYYFEHRLEDYPELLESIKHTTFSDILQRNTDIENLQDDVFSAAHRIGGTDKGETINGTDEKDLIIGFEGDDRLIGDKGDDTLFGNEGTDTLEGGEGDDALHGGRGNDHLLGGTGNDKLHGGKGDDLLEGGEGDDTLLGGKGADYLKGGKGDDTASYKEAGATDKKHNVGITVNVADPSQNTGEAAGDVYNSIEYLEGSKFDDDLTGKLGMKGIFGLSGDDTLHGNLDGIRLDGGVGTDTADFSGVTSGGVNVHLNPSGNDLAKSTDTPATKRQFIADIENIIGTNQADRIWGNKENNVIAGLGGSDDLKGGGGTDTVDYSAATGAVHVSLDGGQGFEHSGTSTTDVDANISGPASSMDTLAGFENITGSAFADRLVGDEGANIIEGGKGADEIHGREDKDTASYWNSDAGVQVTLETLINPADQLGINTGNGDGTATGGDATGDVLKDIENLDGSLFDDELTGNEGVNVLRGHKGDDILTGLGGADELYGGKGNDILDGGWGTADAGDVLDGGKGYDVATYQSSLNGLTINLMNTDSSKKEAYKDTYIDIEEIEGSEFDDIIIGDGSGIVLNGAGGNDTITGKGTDILQGGLGANILTGNNGEGKAVLTYEAGKPVISGGAQTVDYSWYAGTADGGVDVNLANQSGVNKITPGTDEHGLPTYDYAIDDRIYDINNVIGTNSHDHLTGDQDDNHLRGLGGDDKLHGGKGNDKLDGGEGVNQLFGEHGHDLMIGGKGIDAYDGGEGFDIVDYAGFVPEGVELKYFLEDHEHLPEDFVPDLDHHETIDLLHEEHRLQQTHYHMNEEPETTDPTSDHFDHYHIDFEQAGLTIDMTGALSNKDAAGDSFTDVEMIYGSFFQDHIFGDENNNVLAGGTAADDVYGKGGKDILFASGIKSKDLIANYADLFDTSKNHADIFKLLANEIDRGKEDGHSDNANANGAGKMDRLFGGDDADTLIGDGDNDQLFGQEGRDLISGGGGDDYATGGDGDDIIYGDKGDDYIIGQDGADALHGGHGNDVVSGGAGNDVLSGDAGDDKLNGGDGDDRIDGGDGDDTIHGQDGNDKLLGGAGDDYMSGNDGDDYMDGGTGDDIMIGQNGNDTLIGGEGSDIMIGGDGADVFVFSEAENTGTKDTDIIYDFGAGGKDLIDLSGHTTITELDDVTLGEDAHGNAMITLPDDNDMIILWGVDKDSLGAHDFIFAEGMEGI